jgi:hypothetical protein
MPMMVASKALRYTHEGVSRQPSYKLRACVNTSHARPLAPVNILLFDAEKPTPQTLAFGYLCPGRKKKDFGPNR